MWLWFQTYKFQTQPGAIDNNKNNHAGMNASGYFWWQNSIVVTQQAITWTSNDQGFRRHILSACHNVLATQNRCLLQRNKVMENFVCNNAASI